MNKDNKVIWYDRPKTIIISLIVLGLLILIISQSFVINSDISGFKMFGNVLNHNITYMLVLIYSVFLLTKFGKKYFDYINIFLIILYLIIFITSIFTVFQSFSLVTLVSLAIHFILFIYMFHSLLRRTRYWDDLNISKSPFNELNNEWYFNCIVVLEVVLMAINFITLPTFDGIVLSFLDCVFNILFVRYIFLYRNYAESYDKNVRSSLEKEE